MMKTMLIDKQKAQAPVPVKAVEQSCVTCGGAHSYRNCPATDGNMYRDNIQEYVSQAGAANFNQGNTNSRPPMVANQIRPPGFPPIQNNQNRFNQNQGNNFNQNRGTNFNQNRGNNFYQGQVYQPPTSQPPVYQAQPYQAPAQQMQGSLPSNIVTNPKEDLKGITTRSGVAYKGPTIPTSSPKIVERRTEVTKDTIFPTNNGITEDVQPPVVPVENQNLVFEPIDAPISAPMPNPKPSIPYPSRRNDEMRRENADEQKEMDECLALANLGASINLMPFSIWKKFNLPNLTPTCMTLKLADRSISRPIGIAKDVNVKVGRALDRRVPKKNCAFLPTDDPTSPEVDESYYDPERDIFILEELLNSDPSPPPNQGNLKVLIKLNGSLQPIKDDSQDV
ncbi:reverse transcriptase domain-containing protein [Tanacetum coccineum]|uniref:Reverse transcriptase domain-containing protein n=1 Tax=Tanacetum coccineum TaxID=301880 RepID=A0ABQ5FQ48_9ASTR